MRRPAATRSSFWRVLGLILVLGSGLLLVILQSPTASGQTGEPLPIAGLSGDELARWAAGRDIFTHAHVAGEGLGPVFNARACAECHASPGPGGSNATVQNQVVVFGRSDHAGGFDPLVELGGPVRSQRSIKEELPGCSIPPERVPKEANVKSHRQPAPLYGMGLIAAIPDEVILAQIEAGAAADPGEVRGGINQTPHGVGRFGWKAQAATLDEFISGALSEELGITTPLAPTESAARSGSIPAGCDPVPDPDDDGSRLAALVDFVSMLAPPERAGDPDATQRGAMIFQQVGCTACHTPSLSTGPNPIAALNGQEVPLYSDLLIHDLGEYLADDVTQGQATSTEWRTTPLWGLSRKTLYLHDGRTSDLKEVIELHSGEARASRYRLRQRPKADLEAVIAFLRSL